MLDPFLIRYIWTHTRAQQIWILFIVLASMPTYFMSLDLPKYIVNGPIQGTGFETADSTQPFMRIELGLPGFITDKTWLLFEGVELDRFWTLIGLSSVFLVLVIVNGLFKFYINTYKGRLGERMLRRIRYALVDRVLLFPISHFKRVKGAEVASMVKDEVEPLGGFIGDAFVQPLFLGGQAITAMVFIMVQNYLLGSLAIGIIGVQFFIIPKLRRRLIVLNRQRQITARELAGRVSEIVDGVSAVHVNDTSNYERADISSRLGTIFGIRFELYQRKFFVKFLNNFLAQLTPFLFYSVGGYLALTGRLDVGQLVAVIAAYKDLPSPIKELIDWDQQRLEVQVKYTQVIDQFSVDSMMTAELQKPDSDPKQPLAVPIAATTLSLADDTGARLLDRATFTIKNGEIVAFAGPVNAGAEATSEAIARLLVPAAGRLTLGEESIFEIPESLTGRRFSYFGGETFLPQGSVRDNLLYVLKHAPLRPYEYPNAAQRERDIAEAIRSGNSVLDHRADWIDYESAGIEGPDGLLDAMKRVLSIARLDEDIFEFGLRGAIDPDTHPELTQRVIEARRTLRERLSSPELSGLVEPFDPTRYSRQATIAENLLFGTPVGPGFQENELAANAYLRLVLRRTGLDEALFGIGREIAVTAVDLFKDLPPDHPFFEQLSFMTAEQLPMYQLAVQRLQGVAFRDAAEADRALMIRLAFAYIEPRHRMGLLDEQVVDRILEARTNFRENLPADLRGAIEFYDPERYNKAATIQDNLLLGRIAHGIAGAADRVMRTIRALLDELDLSSSILSVGLDFNVGSGGKRLTNIQRQKLGVARALIKRPDYAIFNRPLSGLDLRQQEEIAQRVVEAARDPERPFSVVWVAGNAQMAKLFDRVLVFEHGAIVEDGPPQKLIGDNGAYAKLVA